MQRQSQVVLNQIAAGVEYDDKSSTFTFTPVDDKKNPINKEESPPATKPDITEPVKPTEPEIPVTTEPVTSSVTTTQTTTIREETTTITTSETSVTEQTEKPTETQTQPPETTTLPTETQTTTQISGTYPAFTDMPVFPFYPVYPPFIPGYDYGNNNGNDNWWQNPWENPQNYWGDYCYPMPDYWQYNNNPGVYDKNPELNDDKELPEDTENPDYKEKNNKNKVLPDDEDLIKTANINKKILEGYTVLSLPINASINNKENLQPREEAPVPKSLGSIDFFIIMADKSGDFLAAMNNDELDPTEAQQYIRQIMSQGTSNGMVNNFQFCRSNKKNGTLMVITDKQAELDMLDQLTNTTILIGIISFLVLSVLAFFLSKKSIEPIKIAFEKQKQFVSDASHELKTPLTVISANADVLSGEIGENKWLEYIKSQTERMNILVNDLLNLTRLENNTSEFMRVEFNISQAVTNTALPFECQAFESNKIFELDVEDGIYINGSENHIKQMTAIFIDNALKYSNDGGKVIVSLKKQGERTILSVFNTGDGLKEDEKHKIFERFYRSDDSRSRMTGGYGLGLAIAKSIIDKHKFKITVDNYEGESICFNIIM